MILPRDGWSERAVIVGKDGVKKQLPLDQTRKFSVFEREKIMLAIGHRIRFTKNVKHRGQKFLNNELRNLASIPPIAMHPEPINARNAGYMG
jgi:hypothetical protein